MFGYEVKEVILAISTREALKNLQKNNLSVKVYRVYELYDWIEMRDFLLREELLEKIIHHFYIKGKYL